MWDCSFSAFGVVGAGLFDAGGGTLPATGQSDGTSVTSSAYSTTDPDDLIIAVTASGGAVNPNVPAGFTKFLVFSDSTHYGVFATGAYEAPGTVTGVTATTSGLTLNENSVLFVFAIKPPLVSATVPDIVGLDVAAAEAALTGVGLTVGTETPIPSIDPIGQVLTQDTAAGTVVMLPYSVGFTYSQGSVVPSVVNTAVAVVAPGILAAAGFVLGTQTTVPSGTIIAGNIISQTPAAGSYADVGSAVNVVVSSGLPPLTVPDLFGLSEIEAITLLLSLGLVPGAISSAPSQFVPAGEVQAQSVSAGQAVAVGTIVGFVLSLGTPAVGTLFDFEATVISQYANSPTILQLANNLNQYIDQSTNFANFYNYVWNVDTAVGFGLDIWGVIVGVSRLLNIPTGVDYVGFYQSTESQPDQDWTPAGSDQPPYNNPPVGGAMYTGYNATTAYLLPDDAYRQLILAKAFANICTTTAPAINQILQNLYGPGAAFVLNTGPMAISYNLTFAPTAIQSAILSQSGVIPTPPGVAVTINTGV